MGLLDGGGYGNGMTPQQMGFSDSWGLGANPNPFPQLSQPYGSAPKLGIPGPPQQGQGGGGSGGMQMPGMGGQGQGGGSSPFSNMLFGQNGAVGDQSQGLLGNGGFGNTVQGWLAPSGGQIGTSNMISDGPMAGADFSSMAGAPGLGSVAGGAASGAAGGAAGSAAAGAAGGAAADAAGGAAADAAGGAAGDAAAAALWIVCTELERQKRLPTKHWIAGARTFAACPERVKRGYYIFAIPAVRHLRKHPGSRLSRFLEWTFRARAETLAADLGVSGAKRTALGWIVLHALPPIGHVIGAFVREMPDWTIVYREAK